MDQGMASLATGLAQGISGYLGQQNKQQAEMNNENYKSNLELQRQTALEAQKSSLDTQKAVTQDKTKVGLEDVLSPDMAEQVLPGHGAKMVTDYNTAHPDNPLKLKDGVSYLKAAADALAGPDTEKQKGREQKELFGYQKEYTKDINKEKESLMGINTAGDQIKLAMRNPVAYNSVPITLARAFTGTSRINQVEIQKLGGSSAVLDRLNQIGTQMTSGHLTADNARYMSQLTEMLANSHKANIEDLGLHHASMYRRVSGKSASDAYKDVTGEDMPERFNHPLGDPKHDQPANTNDPLGLFTK